MKRHLILVLTILLAISPVAAQKAKETKLEKNLREHVTYLASDELEGRKTGERGGTVAAGYVSNMFQRFKLKPGFKDDSGKQGFLQPFDYFSGIELAEGNRLSANGRDLRLFDEWLPIGLSPNGSVNAQFMAFAGFGIKAADLNHDDYAATDVRGGIALVLDGTPDSGNPHSAFARFGLHAKANVAKEQGAEALVIISDKDFSKDKPELLYDQRLGNTAIPTAVISRKAAEEILKLESGELDTLAEWLAKRSETPENIKIRIDGIPNLKATIAVNLEKKKAEAYNVIGIVPGRDERLKNEAIVIGAHYDHLGRGGSGSLSPNSSDIHNGADDNASGTASLLELARRIRKEKKNKRTIIFIAFGGEEDGLLGSKAYVDNPVFPIENTVAMINMDMVGRLKDDRLTVGGIGTADVWKELVEKLNTGTLQAKNLPEPGPPLHQINGGSFESVSIASAKIFDLQLSQDGFGPSDHSSFYGKKIPVLFFFTGTHADYHKPSDDADKVNYEGLAKINAFIEEIVLYVDSRADRPAYKVADSAPMGGRVRFNVTLGTIPNYGDSGNEGLAIDGVRNDSPADKAGLKSGDKIVKLAGRDIKNISDYMFVLAEMKAGEEYEVVVMRGGQRVESKIVPEGRD